MIDIDIQISISQRSSGWATNYRLSCFIKCLPLVHLFDEHPHKPKTHWYTLWLEVSWFTRSLPHPTPWIFTLAPPCGLKALPRPFLIQVLLISTPHRALSSNALLSKYLASSWSNWRLCKTLTEKRYYCWEGLHRPDICCERREQRACKILGWV